MAARLPVSRPAVSQHLTALMHSGLVSYEERGTRNIYRLNVAGLGGVRGRLDSASARAGYRTGWDPVIEQYALACGASIRTTKILSQPDA
ncbi:MAG TPA: ArsR family transcriptional regulator [Streptosporangiaceae bacterium]|nr:ArsR family transcriptional regulator [Streptosporangiaceae bacterium]